MKKIKLFDVNRGKEEEKVVLEVLKSGFWASGAGIGKVNEFEKKFNSYIGSKNCIAVNSGTAALHLALSLVDLKNKEVILPSLSFVSTAHSIIYNGGNPVFVDIEPKTLCIDPVEIEKVITKNTKIILPVHFGGASCNLKEISKICKKNKILLIEDAAHAAGATYNKKKIGIHGDAVCFSFHPVKNLAMPTGGAITLNKYFNSMSEKILKSRRWCGITNRKGVDYNVKEKGWNFYMNEFSAAIGLVQLSKLDKLNKYRKKIAKRYANEILINNKMPFDDEYAYHIYWIRVKNRKEFIRKMSLEGIETGIHYKPIHKMTLYSQNKKLPITEQIGREIVSIPMHPNLNEKDVGRIIKNVNKFAEF
jgi:dTDP-4-amino-4,6-dideoxygalactose transaminase